MEHHTRVKTKYSRENTSPLKGKEKVSSKERTGSIPLFHPHPHWKEVSLLPEVLGNQVLTDISLHQVQELPPHPVEDPLVFLLFGIPVLSRMRSDSFLRKRWSFSVKSFKSPFPLSFSLGVPVDGLETGAGSLGEEVPEESLISTAGL